jgi:hypothetical protein
MSGHRAHVEHPGFVESAWRRSDDIEPAVLDPDALTPLQLALGRDPLSSAYDLMFEMVEMVVSKSTHLQQELVGFSFVDGSPSPACAVRVEQSPRLRELLEDMLDRWPVVAHVFQGWSSPDAGIEGYQHVRHEVVVIAVHLHDASRMATCRVSRAPAFEASLFGRREAGASSSMISKGVLRAMTGGMYAEQNQGG